MAQSGAVYPVSVARLPAAFSAWAADPAQMPAGAPGKIGILRLEFAPQRGVTGLAHNYATGPQRVQRALHLDPEAPDMAFAVVQSVSGGVLQGDRLCVAVRVAAGARAHVTTQSAVKIYRMDRNYATQRVDLVVEPGGYLEYLPDFVIPYRSARFYQETELRVAENATLVLAELIAPGRVASGEEFRYDILCTRTQARATDGTLRFTDLVRLEPATTAPFRAGLFASYSHYGSLLVLTRQVRAEQLVTALNQATHGIAPLAGASCLPRLDGAVLRVVGTTGRTVQAAVLSAWSAVRLLLVGAPAPQVQRIKYGFQPATPLPAANESDQLPPQHTSDGATTASRAAAAAAPPFTPSVNERGRAR